jgi:hypothetical protein
MVIPKQNISLQRLFSLILLIPIVIVVILVGKWAEFRQMKE